MAFWPVIQNYQRAAWLPQAAAMDEIGAIISQGAESGTDNGLTNHNLSSTITAKDGTIWTATSVGTLAGVTGTLTSNNAETASSVVQENPDATAATDPNGP